MSAKNNIDIFEKIDNEEKAYWLGFLYADGNVSSKEDKIELSLNEKDYKHLEKFKNFLNISNKICYRERVKAYRISFRSDKCKKDLIKQGCFPKKSLILKFPLEQQVPKHLLRHFVRGYFDGDGCFCNTDKTFSVGIISTEEFLKSLLNELSHIMYTKNQIFLASKNINGAKKYVFSAEYDVYKFLNWIYKDANVYLDRKYEKYLDYIKNGIKKKCRPLE